MNRSYRHDRIEREAQGEYDAKYVVRFLNLIAETIQEKRAKTRYQALFAHIRTLLELLKSRAVNADEVTDVSITINKSLAKYPLCPVIVTEPAKSVRGFSIGDAFYGGKSATEAFAVHSLLSVVSHNLFDRIQLCQCSKWYFAKFFHQRFCSPGCRVRFWETSEERKQQKRERARENYQYKKIHHKRGDA